jgi:hypothetical protein
MEMMSRDDVVLAEGRSCDGCTMCCKLLSVDELEKPRYEWCVHCEIGVGCKIYEERPLSCRHFYCGYVLHAEFGEHWNPTKSKMVIAYESENNRIVVHVDPGRVGAWREEPYYSEIKDWAIRASENQGQVIVWQGQDAIAVLPDRDKNLGPVREDQFIVTSEKRRLDGVELDVMVVDRGDPILDKLS